MIPASFPMVQAVDRAYTDDHLARCVKLGVMAATQNNPIIGHTAAIDRLEHVGKLLGTAQTMIPYEALCAYTLGGATLSGDADNRGSITPGKWADLVVLSGDPLTFAKKRPMNWPTATEKPP